MNAPSPNDRPELHKVAQMLPWLIGARTLNRQIFVRVAVVYSIGGDLAVALAGIGIGTPLTALFLGKADSGANALAIFRTVLPDYLTPVGVAALAVWVALRVFVQNQDAVTKARRVWDLQPLFRTDRKAMDEALAEPAPMIALGAIHKRISDDALAEAIDYIERH